MEKYSKLDGWTETHSVHFNFSTKDVTVAYDIAAQLEEIINNNRDKFTGHSIHMDSNHHAKY